MEFHLKTITPCFLRGADSNRAELRTPSVRGQLRWWFRAMQSEDNIAALKQAETDLFGSASLVSPVSVRCIPIPSKKDFKATTIRNYYGLGKGGFDPKNKRHTGPNNGIKYLLNRALTSEAFFKDGFCFKAHLRHTEQLDADQDAVQKAAKALWLWVHLGGLGFRSRRGFGNLICTNTSEVSGLDGLPFIFQGNTAEALQRHLACVTSLVTSTGMQKYSSLKGATIYILQEPFEDWQQALQKLGSEYEEFRYNRRQASLWDGANFGFPVVKSNRTQIVGEDFSRRASPLIFKVWANQNGSAYFAGFVHLRGKLTPANELIQIRKGTKEDWVKINGPQTASPQPVEDFLKTLSPQAIDFTI